jgi:tRNA-splicing ligase RtcB (3'-phosphate/5'-hydroxy nucleic acid ligase)
MRQLDGAPWCTTITITLGASTTTGWSVKAQRLRSRASVGFVGGSMGDDAVIIEGVDSPEAKASLVSTIHGAGRLFGRKEVKRRFTRAEDGRLAELARVTLVGADLDESPMAYRRLPEVLITQDSVKVLHTLRPFAVAMAGEGEFDPFKD